MYGCLSGIIFVNAACTRSWLAIAPSSDRDQDEQDQQRLAVAEDPVRDPADPVAPRTAVAGSRVAACVDADLGVIRHVVLRCRCWRYGLASQAGSSAVMPALAREEYAAPALRPDAAKPRPAGRPVQFERLAIVATQRRAGRSCRRAARGRRRAAGPTFSEASCQFDLLPRRAQVGRAIDVAAHAEGEDGAVARRERAEVRAHVRRRRCAST